MESSTVFCYFENARFPAAEFTADEEGRIVHQRMPLHTVHGALLEGETIPLPPAEPLPPPPQYDE